jgi:two-component system response regulator GlrR
MHDNPFMRAKSDQTKGKILLVDDDPGLLRLLSIRLRAEEFDVVAVESAHDALGSLNRFSPDLVITDLRMDKMDGIGLLKELQTRSPGLRVIIITAHGTIPDDKDELLSLVERALKVSGTVDVEEDWAAEIITRNAAMKEVLQQAKMVAATDARVLITGESGTGKELLAKAIHRASARHNRPFTAINCSAMAENLLESELFGHEKGAFTGATRSHEGLFQAAEGGTLMLDEIGDMPMRLQVKLLRVLQEHQVRPVGSTEAKQIDVRVISATHRDLQELMREGRFRADLYYRLNVVNIKLPTLDQRKEDIPLADQERKVYAPEAVEMLVTAEWPGNIRQLYNVVRQNVALSRSPVISGELVQQSLGEHAGKLASFSDARDEFTRNYLSQILQITMGNVSQAARLAKRNRTDFYKLLARHDLNPDSFKTR